MTKTQKKELKARLLKILHGVCYVLSAIFVLVLIVASIKGCSPKKQRTNTSQELAPQQLNYNSRSQLTYKFKYDNDTTIYIPFDVQNEYLIDFPIGSYSIDVNIQDISMNNYVKLVFEVVSFGDLVGVGLDYVSFIDSNNVTSKIIDYNGDENALYNTYYIDLLFVNNNSFYNSVFDLLFEEVEPNSFIFNKQFNYNAPMGISVDSPYGSGANWTTSTQYMAHLDYNVGWFLSNGQLFDTIQYWCTSAGDSDFELLTSSGTSRITTGATGSWAYIWLYYVNSETNVSVIANYRNQVAYIKDTTTNAYYYQNSSTWQNDEYRYVYFLNDLSDSLSTKIQAFNNNNQYFGGSINGGSPFDVFGLVGSAFTSILPLLSIMVLPNITLGMLLFVPLVAILVFAIVKIVKK